jgi:hypothetical protein
MAIDLENIINYYVNLLIIQYNNKEKARKTIELNIRTLINDNIVCEVQDAFNLETAAGEQLDIIGNYVGVDRFYSSISELVGEFFGMTSYSTLGSDTTVGMTDFTGYATDVGGFATYEDLGAGQKLDDDDYRFIIKLRIVQNNINHSHKSIDDGLFQFFGSDLVMSANDNMTMVYFITGSAVDLGIIAFSKGVLPRPMAVRINGLIERDKPFFGFTTYNQTLNTSGVTGFTDYTKGFSKVGQVLTYDKVITL